MRLVQAGQKEAFEHIVRKYQAKVLGLCASLLSDTAGAEDAAQDIFIKAYQSINQFHGGSSFFTWLYRVAFNHCQDLLRKRNRRPTESWDELVERHGEKIEKLLASPFDPVSDSHDETSDLVERVLSALPHDYRAILILREVQSLNYQEIAEVLNCSLDAVKARLRRARQTLAAKLRQICSH